MIVVTVSDRTGYDKRYGWRHDFRRLAPAIRWARTWMALPWAPRVCIYDEPSRGPLHRLFDSQYGLPWEHEPGATGGG